MWLQDCLNDLYDAGVNNRNLAIIYEANSKNKVAVKTPNDTTDRIVIENIVLQGEVLAPLECSVSVDTFGKECQEEEKYVRCEICDLFSLTRGVLKSHLADVHDSKRSFWLLGDC